MPFSQLHIEKLYGGKAHVGPRIPDPDTREAVVVSVKNFSGFVSINGDGSWVCEGQHGYRSQHYPDPVEEVKKQASFLEQRGVALPEGYFSYKVILPNPKFYSIYSSNFPPEVITFEQWTLLKPQQKNMLSGWLKGAFSGGKKEMQESINQQLNFILSTAPIGDRLEVKGNKYVLGEFI
ncbi:uncharacterized protein LOC123205025 isoform X2 [Mangifera indica]|uniref:uncharacterized protein LOC123205025 isoform X2 n=1 Tax=Mangifera indica TaxID=29780 RepID=UPI001CFB8A5F|nr:uncharacterized protein LOC123205025 isoform X2 [Mangifera indica]